MWKGESDDVDVIFKYWEKFGTSWEGELCEGGYNIMEEQIF
jgi:hypothetical protein